MPRRRYGAGRSSSSGFFLSSGKIRETQELPPGGVCNHPHMSARVLVVDDHPSFRRLASKLLAAGGNSWVSLIFPELREKPEDDESAAP